MSRGQTLTPATRLALRKSDAAEALGISEDTFERYVQPELRVVRVGSLRLYPVAELQSWLEKSTATAPAEELGL